MGLAPKPSFAAGELDPALWERTNLDKYRTGMATARNVIVTKNGSVTSRMATSFFKQTKLDNRAVVLYSPAGSPYLLELGHLYLRVYNYLTGALLLDTAQNIAEASIPLVHFETSGSFVYIFCAGYQIQKFNYALGAFVIQSGTGAIFARPPVPEGTIFVTPVGAPAGYTCDYQFTYVFNGEESQVADVTGGPYAVPIAAGQSIIFILTIGAVATLVPGVTEVRVYRRPSQGGVFGFIGSTSYIYTSGSDLRAAFTELGGAADYTHTPPSLLTPNFVDPIGLNSPTGLVYQQRLIITDGLNDLEALYASRPGFQDNFNREFPYSNDSAFKFKSGSSGYARVLRLLDSDGLVVFTAAGIYLNQGALTPENLALAKKGKWIINAGVPPLAVPGGTLFIDQATNAVRDLQWNQQMISYDAEELSIYSNHLFRYHQISTWNFQAGVFPVLWIVFNDGTLASFTYQFDQQMRAWCRHDGAMPFRSSCGTTTPDLTFFVVSKLQPDGVTTIRQIMSTIPRYATPLAVATDPQANLTFCPFMDAIVTTKTTLNASLRPTDTLQLTNLTSDDWTQPLNLSCGSSKLFPNSAGVAIGKVYRLFDELGTAIDLTVTAWTDINNVTVSFPLDVFPSRYANNPLLYNTTNQVVNCQPLVGETVAVVVDGAVVSSPNNDVDNYPQLTVDANGILNLPKGMYGAIIHVGRPIVADIVTLDIDTVEQGPTLIESIQVDKLYIKVKDSQGLFVGNSLPAGNSVKGMELLDTFDVDYTQPIPIIGNRVEQPKTKRVELTLPGDWNSQGKIAIRQVDPLHFEILSIIPDVEILKRSDR